MNSSLSISALTARNENTLALASANFNFSLISVEPPEEYKKLGERLSSKRRTAAEEGSVHITARKLGALFEQIIQLNDALIKAYGLRASEISASPVANPKGSSSHGFFRDQVGADGTTIWAAATSGKSAIAMNLLACFLARLWTPPEAISIWVELVECRKREIMDTLDGSEPSHLAPISAAKQSITREELSEWDAGARAWLRAGDIVKEREVKQLKLIANSLGLPVDGSQDVYTSVIQAWKKAMETVGKLITGIAHRIQSGAVLLALSSWHIYPDMLVLGETEKYVSQKDPLVPREAYITIGFQNLPSSDDEGVHWSLSLARLRYYGPPVSSTRSAGVDAERLSFNEFLFVFLGIFLGGWRSITTDWLMAAELITSMWEAIAEEAASTNSGAQKAQEFVRASSTWIYLLYQTARTLLDSEGADREQAMRLVKVGSRRKTSGFLCSGIHPYPAFGLTKFWNYVFVLRDEERVGVLLNAARRTGVSAANNSSNTHNSMAGVGQSYGDAPQYPRIEASRTLRTRSCSGSFTRRQFEMGIQYKGPDLENMATFTQVYFSPGYDQSDFKRIAEDDMLISAYVERCDPVPISDVITALKSKKMDIEKLLDLLRGAEEDDEPDTYQHVTSLRAVASLARSYKLLPNATVAIKVTQMSLYEAHWCRRSEQENRLYSDKLLARFQPFALSRDEAFASVAMFETGSLDMPPHMLRNVMAMSIGDSIYVSAPLLCDPSEEPEAYELKRVTGNIGRAGVAFMIPPMNPQIKKPSSGNWRVINHHHFDGKARDSFQSTSLHLSFTGYEQPVVGDIEHGARDVEAHFLETVVSVHDRGQWIGDLDILQTLADHSSFQRFVPVPNCGHAAQILPPFKLCSIDNWDELLDKPEDGQGIVRANGNWLARLASASLSVQSDLFTCVFRDKICWECYRQLDFVKERSDWASVSMSEPVIIIY